MASDLADLIKETIERAKRDIDARSIHNLAAYEEVIANRNLIEGNKVEWLLALIAEVDHLTAENARLETKLAIQTDSGKIQSAMIESLLSQIAKLREAAKPFIVRGPRTPVYASTEGELWIAIHVRAEEIDALRSALSEEEKT